MAVDFSPLLPDSAHVPVRARRALPVISAVFLCSGGLLLWPRTNEETWSNVSQTSVLPVDSGTPHVAETVQIPQIVELDGWGSWFSHTVHAAGGAVATASHAVANASHDVAEHVSNVNWTQAGQDVVDASHSAENASQQVVTDALNTTGDALQNMFQTANADVAELRTTNWTAVGSEIETAGTNISDQLHASIHAYRHLVKHPAPGSIHIDWSCAGKVLAAAGITAGATGAATSTLMPMVLEALGFSEDGVVMDSAAARIQSSIGNVEKGSVFALLQSIAMGGASQTSYVLVAAGAGGAGGVEYVLRNICRPREWYVTGSNGAEDRH